MTRRDLFRALIGAPALAKLPAPANYVEAVYYSVDDVPRLYRIPKEVFVGTIRASQIGSVNASQIRRLIP